MRRLSYENSSFQEAPKRVIENDTKLPASIGDHEVGTKYLIFYRACWLDKGIMLFDQGLMCAGILRLSY